MSKPVKLSPEQLEAFYRDLYLVRRFDEEAKKLYQRNLIQGAVHSYAGEEAIAVGACQALRKDDFITSTHRGHGHCLAKGGRPDRMMAEILGKATGYCKGKGGSMHIADIQLGILGANGIVGGGIGSATGSAFSAKYLGKDNVTVCFFGDGALHQGVFHECANMASLWKLPVIYLAEYNQFAEFTHSVDTFSTQNLVARSAPYGFPAFRIDGNDVIEVFQTVSAAVKRARAGEGPTLIIADTFRLEGHYIGDPLTYRTENELAEALKREPVGRFRKQLLEKENVPQEAIRKIESEVEETLKQAIAFAIDSPEPGLDELTTDIYSPEFNKVLAFQIA